MTVCACLGPQNGEPLCPCRMKAVGPVSHFGAEFLPLTRKQEPPLSLQQRADAAFGPCNCVGPQNGQPLCPCQMRGVQIKDGRYVRITDLGPAPC